MSTAHFRNLVEVGTGAGRWGRAPESFNPLETQFAQCFRVDGTASLDEFISKAPGFVPVLAPHVMHH